MTLVICGGVILFMHGHITKNKTVFTNYTHDFQNWTRKTEKTIKKMKKN